MVLEAGNDLEIRVTAKLQKSGTTVLVKAMIASVESKPKPFYQAAFLLSKEPPPPPALEPPLDVTAPAHITSEVFYTQHTFHGPSFRLIQTITGLDQTGVDATILPDWARLELANKPVDFSSGCARRGLAAWHFLDTTHAQ